MNGIEEVFAEGAGSGAGVRKNRKAKRDKSGRTAYQRGVQKRK